MSIHLMVYISIGRGRSCAVEAYHMAQDHLMVVGDKAKVVAGTDWSRVVEHTDLEMAADSLAGLHREDPLSNVR